MAHKTHLQGLHFKRGAAEYTDDKSLVTCKQCLKWIDKGYSLPSVVTSEQTQDALDFMGEDKVLVFMDWKTGVTHHTDKAIELTDKICALLTQAAKVTG